ncbi:MAG: hypothetical protein H7X88_01830 [Gloeobacteraceae cyanobacterium ES-bin-316]|nr:hypothetical protein [Ferruginibacter sp.]
MAHNQLQQKCWQYLWNYYPDSRYTCWHTKNEDIPYPGETKKSYMIRRSQDKAVGLLPGVWDLVFYKNGVLHIFDVKVGKDKLSESQIRFRDQIVGNGGKAYVIENIDTFIQIIKQIYDGVE